MVLRRRAATLHGIALLAAAAPLAELGLRLAGGLVFEPVEAITQRTGQGALWLLTASLACTPAYTLFGARWAIPLRRTLGLAAFAYASFHLLSVVGLDFGFDAALILTDGMAERPFIVIGLSAYLLLAPLAVTSTRGWMRRLGKRWKVLHRAVYAAICLVLVHFTWAVKPGLFETWPWVLLIGALLVARVPSVRRSISALRHRRRSVPDEPIDPARPRSGGEAPGES